MTIGANTLDISAGGTTDSIGPKKSHGAGRAGTGKTIKPTGRMKGRLPSKHI